MSKSRLTLSRDQRAAFAHSIAKWVESIPVVAATNMPPPLALPEAEPELCKQCGGPPGKRRRLRRQFGRVHQNGPCSDAIHSPPPRQSARARAGGKGRKRG